MSDVLVSLNDVMRLWERDAWQKFVSYGTVYDQPAQVSGVTRFGPERRCGGDRRIGIDRREVNQIGRRFGPADRRQQ